MSGQSKEQDEFWTRVFIICLFVFCTVGVVADFIPQDTTLVKKKVSATIEIKRDSCFCPCDTIVI